MRRIFDGFDKLSLMLGTSVFYVAALSLVLISLWLNSFTMAPKSPEFHNRSNLTPDVAQAPSDNYLRSYATDTGFRSVVVFNPAVNAERVLSSVLAIMDDKQFAQLAIEFNCSRVDCRVDFSSVDDNLHTLSGHANQRLALYLAEHVADNKPLN